MSNVTWVYFDALIFCLIAFVPFFFIKKKGNILYYSDRKYRQLSPLVFILIIIYCVYDHTGGDYFHYQSIIAEIRGTKFVSSHLESPYIIIAQYFGNNYSFWRLCVWGTALLGYRQIIKKLCISEYKSYWIFSLVSLLPFATGRVSLAIVICLLGIYLFKSTTFCKKAVGLCLIITSAFFHKSLYIFIVAFIISYIPLVTVSIIVFIILVPIVVFVINRYLYVFVLLLSNDTTSIAYFSQERIAMGNGELINTLLIWFPIIYYLFYNRNYFLNNRNDFIRIIFKLVFFLLLLSLTMYFLDFGSASIPTRIRNMCYIPISILFLYHLREPILTKKNAAILISLLLGNLYQLSYLLYLKKIGLGV